MTAADQITFEDELLGVEWRKQRYSMSDIQRKRHQGTSGRSEKAAVRLR